MGVLGNEKFAVIEEHGICGKSYVCKSSFGSDIKVLCHDKQLEFSALDQWSYIPKQNWKAI